MTDIRPTRSIVEESQEGAGRHLVLDHDHVVNFVDGDATPSVASLTRFRAVGAATITNFLKGAPAQVIHILGNGTTTVAHNANIKRATGVSGVLAADRIYSFMYDVTPSSDIWYEQDSNGGGGGGGGAPLPHAASHQDGGSDEISVTGLSGELADAQKVVVRKNSGADIGTRRRLNLIEGSNVTLTVTDDGGDSEVDITIAAAGGNPADDTHVWMPLTTVVGGVPELVWDGDNSLIPTLVPV